MLRDSTARFESSHLGYSPVGQVVTWGSLPALLVVAALASNFDGPTRWAVFALGVVPAGIWLVGKAMGPDGWPWFYRRPGTCSFSPSGLDWTSEMPGTPRQGHIDWLDIAGVDRRPVRLGVVGMDGSLVAHVRADLLRLRPSDREEDWSFAQALVSYRPNDYVLTDLILYGMPAGARRRKPEDGPSDIQPAALTRDPQVAMALYLALIGLVSLVEAILRR